MEISEPFYGRSLQSVSVRDVYEQIIALVLNYRIRLPRSLLLLLKTFIQAEALGKILNSDANILEVTRPYAENLVQKGYDTQKLFKTIGRETRSLWGSTHAACRAMSMKSCARRPAGNTSSNSAIGDLSSSIAKSKRGINRLTVGAVISASTIAASLI
jgi:ubiquinone biosynthesis protein